ncbi:MAG: hemerythrin [Pseudonocardiales bacterium]|nr:hemerythrin [Pseudonocardiales bacterium]
MSDGSQQTILDALSSDHRAIEALLDDAALADVGEDGDAARAQLVMAVIPHFVAEEQYLYPAVRRHVTDGDALANTGYAGDRACEQMLKDLEGTDVTAPQIMTTIAEVRRMFHEHVRLQQETIFPTLARDCDVALLFELGDDVLGAELLAPTRPRLIATSSPGVNKLTSIVEGFIDRVRDSYTKRGVDPELRGLPHRPR